MLASFSSALHRPANARLWLALSVCLSHSAGAWAQEEAGNEDSPPAEVASEEATASDVGAPPASAASDPGPESVDTLPTVVVDSTPSDSAPVRFDDRMPTPVRTDTSTAVFDTVERPGKDEDLIELAVSASSGQASAAELIERPTLRRGELLEVVPGMIVTQHSGTGKANQYFVRGFNLDHGTDFGLFVDGMPVNQRTHGHGQGYADAGFIIPEVVERLDYTKGPYFSDLGDFTSAGSARFRLYDILPHGELSVTGGEDDYFRFLAMDSVPSGPGMLSMAVEYMLYDGPWVLEENTERINTFLKYYWEKGINRYSVTGMLYRGEWDSTDQIPERLVDQGRIDRLGFVDPTVGGESQRYSGSFNWIHDGADSLTEVDAYLGYYDLDLFSNFTYFLDNPVRGDQFNQVDERVFAGLQARNTRDNRVLGRDGELTVGFQSHHDWIDGVGLHRTRNRQRFGTVRSDDVREHSLAGYVDQKVEVNDWMRLTGGFRGDLYHFDVSSDRPENSGEDWAGIVSPKMGAVLGPWNDTEFYANWGGGFHSNDARGVTISADPVTGLPSEPVDPLVRQWGTEVGTRTRAIENVTTSLSLWYLESDSELLFVGDAGNTEAGPGARRYGIEWAAYWKPTDWLRFDSELTATQAEFRDLSAGGREVENAIPLTHSAGVTIGGEEGPYASLRSRYFSPRPLAADGSVKSRDSLVFNLRAGFRRGNADYYVDVLNLFDTDANDIEYLYESRLPWEAAGVEDIHFHPIEPRTLRAGVKIKW